MSGYFEEADPARIAREYPIGEAFLRGPARLDPERLRALQQARLEAVLARAWRIPFYARRWRAAGLEPGDVRTIEDLPRLPAFSKSDLMRNVEEHPPLGDFHGRDLPDAPRHVVLHTTSGTTGAPQPLVYGPRDREIQNCLLARAYRLQGLRDDDVVHSVYGFGMVNGGHYIRETLLHYTGCLALTAGTGVETPSVQQVRLMQHFGVTALVGFGDYMTRLAEVARTEGIEPGRDIRLRLISGHVDHATRDALSAAWGGAPVRDWYGVGDTGILAAEGPEPGALFLWEDAHLVEVVDPDSGRPLPDGETGNLCVTVLFKDGIYPIVRFDTKDLSRVLPGRAEPVPAFRRIAGFLGRSDNMVKLRGVNVYPTAVAGWLRDLAPATGEYICRVERVDGVDRMTVEVEWQGARDARTAAAVAAHLRARAGVELVIELVAPGATAARTGVERRQKPVRLVDAR
ncbi:MAG: AMP-binding protein [Ectothiorhodospiraceae bacterium]|nr:AMP-binding protein [Ectothiorhodospiraceae bacterium]